jgi:hypothetical protein
MKHFRSFSRTKKIVALGAVAALTLGVAGTAFAYFTGGGSGTGSALVGAAPIWTVGQTGPAVQGGLTTSTDPALYPDAASGAATGPPFTNGMNPAGEFLDFITYTVANTSNSSEYLHSVQVSVANSDGSAWASQSNTMLPACTAADFSIIDETADVNLANGATFTDISFVGSFSAHDSTQDTFGLEMIDNGLNQDNCAGVSVPLYFLAS